jgi:hypothetical protein
MAPRDSSAPKCFLSAETVPFGSAEEAWFWFIHAQEAKESGAQIVAGQSLYPRPCEPVDIYRALDKLYRQRRLVRDHLLVLRHYGRRRLPPDPYRVKEARAHTLWQQAMERLGTVLMSKGIVSSQPAEMQGQLL